MVIGRTSAWICHLQDSARVVRESNEVARQKATELNLQFQVNLLARNKLQSDNANKVFSASSSENARNSLME